MAQPDKILVDVELGNLEEVGQKLRLYVASVHALEVRATELEIRIEKANQELASLETRRVDRKRSATKG